MILACSYNNLYYSIFLTFILITYLIGLLWKIVNRHGNIIRYMSGTAASVLPTATDAGWVSSGGLWRTISDHVPHVNIQLLELTHTKASS